MFLDYYYNKNKISNSNDDKGLLSVWTLLYTHMQSKSLELGIIESRKVVPSILNDYNYENCQRINSLSAN